MLQSSKELFGVKRVTDIMKIHGNNVRAIATNYMLIMICDVDIRVIFQNPE